MSDIFDNACSRCGHSREHHLEESGCIEDQCPSFVARIPGGDTSRLDTDEIRSSTLHFIRKSAEAGENPGALIRYTLPGLCDEVDRLRAKVNDGPANPNAAVLRKPDLPLKRFEIGLRTRRYVGSFGGVHIDNAGTLILLDEHGEPEVYYSAGAWLTVSRERA